MKSRIIITIVIFFSTVLSTDAQELKVMTWASYNVSFKAPTGLNIEENSEDEYTVSNDMYYITIQLLESNGMKRSELAKELKNIANEDGLTNQTETRDIELPQFYGTKLKGTNEIENCLYCYLLAKDESCAFYVSISYQRTNDTIPETILDSFELVE